MGEAARRGRVRPSRAVTARRSRRAPKGGRRLLLLVLGSGLALLLAAPPGAAHAWLRATEPPADAVLATPPAHVTLRFTEHIERDYTAASVWDASGQRVDEGHEVHPDGRRDSVRVRLPELPDGTYRVDWRVLSVDSHTTAGSFLFGVGNVSLQPSQHPHHAHDSHFTWSESLWRGVGFWGLTALAGTAAFALGAGSDRALLRPAAHARLRRLAWAGAAAMAASTLVLLAIYADRIGASAASAAGTRTGMLMLARLAFAALAAGAVALAARAGASRGWALGGWGILAGAAALTVSAGSHGAAAGGTASTLVLADVAHLLAGAVWLGGILGLLCMTGTVPSSDLARGIVRFSGVAITAVAGAAATGVYAAAAQLPDLAALSGSLYGRVLVAKVLLVAATVAVGGWNRLRVAPRLASGRAHARALRVPLAVEAGLLAAVLLAAGVLATVSPPQATPEPDGLVWREPFGDGRAVLRVQPEPVVVGVQRLEMRLEGVAGAHDAEAFVKFQPPGRPPPDDLVPMQPAGHGQWTLQGGYMTTPGTWTVHLLVQSPGAHGRYTFEVPVVQG